MKILALDYDGVIIDSQLECLLVGFNAYLELNPKTKLFNGEKFTFDNFDKKINENKELVIKHNNLRVYIISAVSWNSIFHIIENGIEIKNQEDFDKIENKLKDQSSLYDKYFYEERLNLQKQDFNKWVSINKPFSIVKKLNNHKTVIVTSNSEKTIKGFLREHNVKCDLILDKTYGIDKTKKIKIIKDRYNINFEDIHFLDDQVSFFKPLIQLGVKCFLATWGYNNKEQQEEAKKLGVELISLDDFYEKIINSKTNI